MILFYSLHYRSFFFFVGFLTVQNKPVNIQADAAAKETSAHYVITKNIIPINAQQLGQNYPGTADSP